MNLKRIERIIADYKSRFKGNDTWLEHSLMQDSLSKSIEVSATATNMLGKKHPHQHRIPLPVLQDFARELQTKITPLQLAVSFDELHGMISASAIDHIGEMAIYDTALRIGAYLNLHPDRIYLHRGTREGAELFVGRANRKFIFKEELPKPFQEDDLTASDIEDILCIYKSKLATCI